MVEKEVIEKACFCDTCGTRTDGAKCILCDADVCYKHSRSMKFMHQTPNTQTTGGESFSQNYLEAYICPKCEIRLNEKLVQRKNAKLVHEKTPKLNLRDVEKVEAVPVKCRHGKSSKAASVDSSVIMGVLERKLKPSVHGRARVWDAQAVKNHILSCKLLHSGKCKNCNRILHSLRKVDLKFKDVRAKLKNAEAAAKAAAKSAKISAKKTKWSMEKIDAHIKSCPEKRTTRCKTCQSIASILHKRYGITFTGKVKELGFEPARKKIWSGKPIWSMKKIKAHLDECLYCNTNLCSTCKSISRSFQCKKHKGFIKLLEACGVEERLKKLNPSGSKSRNNCKRWLLDRFVEDGEFRWFYEEILKKDKRTKCYFNYRQLANGDVDMDSLSVRAKQDDTPVERKMKNWISRLGFREVWVCAKEALEAHGDYEGHHAVKHSNKHGILLTEKEARRIKRECLKR